MEEKVKSTKKRKKKGTRKVAPVTTLQEVSAPTVPEEIAVADAELVAEAPRPVVTKRVTRRLIMLALSGACLALGVALFILYFFNMNMAVGAPAVLLGVGGFFGFRYYWRQGGDVVVEQIGEKPKVQMNSLGIYRNEIKFENIKDPKGYPQECKNDHKKYYVHIYELPGDGTGMQEFCLPDQQYYDPTVFAERPLSLPAHRRLFTLREKLGQYIKTAMLLATAVLLWILILTTTGGD